MAKEYDLVVLGGGIGGYTAAIRAAQLGKKVAVVERDKLGGTCLHRGCIPSKALLRSAELFAQMKNSDAFGIRAASVEADYAKVHERKAGIVEQLHKGLQLLLKKNNIDVWNGFGRLIGPSIFSPKSGTVAVEREDGEAETLVPQALIIATGSRPRMLPGLNADGTRIMTSDDAVQMEELPRSIIIVGGGAVGVEWASLLNDFGAEVTVVEAAERLLPGEDADISQELARLLARRGIRIMTGAQLRTDSVETSADGVRAVAAKGGEEIRLSAERMLVSVGREACVTGFGLENTDVQLYNGFIKVNPHFQTAEPHIYAVGDVIGGVQLAHAAAWEGVAAAEHIAGRKPHRQDPRWIPRCVYSRPETAGIGWTEQQAKENGCDVAVGRIPFRAVGKALIHGEPDGFVKVVADRRTDDIVGVHMIGPNVTELISEAALARLLEATPWEMGLAIRPHPTLSEIVSDAMLAVEGRAIYM